MRQIIARIPPILKNFYFLTFLFFFFWMVLFDSNDLITQTKLSAKEIELERAREFYLQKISEVKADREALLNDKDLLEKLAREKYFMRKENEDVFVVVEQ